MSQSVRFKRALAEYLGDLEKYCDNDEIGAVQINVVLRNGNVQTLQTYDSDFSMALIAASAIGQQKSFNLIGHRPLENESWDTAEE